MANLEDVARQAGVSRASASCALNGGKPVSEGLRERVLRVLRRAGVRVPEELAVAGVDDIAWARRVEPALTTVRRPVRASSPAHAAEEGERGPPRRGGSPGVRR